MIINPDIRKNAAHFIGLIPNGMREEMDYEFRSYDYDLTEEIRDNPLGVFLAMAQRSFHVANGQLRWYRQVIKELGYEGDFEPLLGGGGWNAGEYRRMLDNIEKKPEERYIKHLLMRPNNLRSTSQLAWIFTKSKQFNFPYINWLNTNPLEDKP